jgi:hypothetical protein
MLQPTVIANASKVTPNDARTRRATVFRGGGDAGANDKRLTLPGLERGVVRSGDAPSDAAGGYVQVGVTNVGAQGLAELVVTSVVDNDVLIDTYTTDEGASIKAWFTVAPGARYPVEVNRFGVT